MGGSEPGRAGDWRVRGSYFEGCNCEAICPCRSVGGRPGGPDGADLPDRRAVQAGDRSAGPAEEDAGQRFPLPVAGVLVDVEHDLPAGAGMHPVEVTDREHGPQPGQVGAVGVALVDVPGQGAEALPERGRPPGAPAYAPARADRLAVASLEIGAPYPPVTHPARCRFGHHMPPIWPESAT